MSFWSLHHLDLHDAINLEIWESSPAIQQELDDGYLPREAELYQMVAGEGGLPWVPDLVGRQWRTAGAVFVVGSAYSPFIYPMAGRSCSMGLLDYQNAESPAAFQKSFVPEVVQPDRNYYGRIEELVSGVASDASQMLVLDLCRACFVRFPDLEAGDNAIKADPDFYIAAVDANEDWTWRRLVESAASCIIALGSIAEHGLLRLLHRKAISSHVARQPEISFQPDDRPVTEYANNKMKIGGWLSHETWWVAEGEVDGQTRRWKILPAYHPSRANNYDSGYQKTRGVLEKMVNSTRE